jgi:DNA-binding MarR family transcriptional regulator
VASQDDGRRILLELTHAGRALVDAMHAHRQAEFAQAMRDWSETERQDFARLLTRFTQGDA